MRIWLIGLALLIGLAGCFEDKKTGPVDLKLGRDVCTHCGMIIDDPRFAAELRGGADRRLYKFDDLGDAILWLAKQSWANDPATEIWVGDLETGQWIDGRQALYVRVKASPMGHGFGATLTPKDDALPFEAVRQIVRARGVPGTGPRPAGSDDRAAGHAHSHPPKDKP
jgi:hypothetical protein